MQETTFDLWLFLMEQLVFMLSDVVQLLLDVKEMVSYGEICLFALSTQLS